jgi:hypothetical protein
MGSVSALSKIVFGVYSGNPCSYTALEILNQFSMLNISILGNLWRTDPESKVKLATFQTYGTVGLKVDQLQLY